MRASELSPETLARVRQLGDQCRAKGCKCLNRCWYVWNRYWIAKAECCTHPNFAPPDHAKGEAPKSPQPKQCRQESMI